MEQDNTLKKLFGQFEQSIPDLMSVDAVEQKINSIQQPTISNPKKITIMTTTITSIGIAAIIAFNMTGNKGREHAAAVSIPFSKQTPAVLQLPLNDKDTQKKQIRTLIINHDQQGTNNQPANTGNQQKHIVIEEASDMNATQGNKQTIISGPDIGVVPAKNLPPLLILSDEELFRLGIVGKDGGIFYEETFNKENPFRMNVIADGNKRFYSVKGGDADILKNSDKYPYIITDKCIQWIGSPLNRKELKDTIEIYSNYKKYFPVYVSNKMEGPDAAPESELIFWFPKSEYIISLMPERVKAAIAINPDACAWDMRTGREYFKEKQMTHVTQNNPEANCEVDVVSQQPYLQPDKALYSKLGFNFDKNGQLGLDLKYKKFFYKIHKEGEGIFIEVDYPSADYYRMVMKEYKLPVPLFISDSLCKGEEVQYMCGDRDKDPVNELQLLLNTKHRLTPVRVPLSRYRTKYFWYENNDKFLNCLNAGMKNFVEATLKDSTAYMGILKSAKISTVATETPDLKKIYEFNSEKFDKVTPLVSGEMDTRKLGYELVDKDLRLYVTSENGEVATLTHTKYGTIISDDKVKVNLKDIIMPVYISDDLGKHTYISITDDSTNAPIDFDQLIPVLVQTGRSYTLNDMVNKAARPDYLLWYKATPEFLKTLPQPVYEDIKKELVKTPGTAPTIPCKYTDVCKQHKENLAKALVYPNPANKTLSIDVEFKVLVPLTISVADLSGKIVIQRQWTPGELNAGTTIDVSALESGIYYLYMQSAKNDMVVQKVLVTH